MENPFAANLNARYSNGIKLLNDISQGNKIEGSWWMLGRTTTRLFPSVPPARSFS